MTCYGDVVTDCDRTIVAHSEYFDCKFQHENTVEVTQGSVDLQLLDVDAVKLVIDFMYSGKIEFEFHMVQEVMKGCLASGKVKEVLLGKTE